MSACVKTSLHHHFSQQTPVMSTTGREKIYKTKIFGTLNNMQQTEYCLVIAATIRYNIGLIHGANVSDK